MLSFNMSLIQQNNNQVKSLKQMSDKRVSIFWILSIKSLRIKCKKQIKYPIGQVFFQLSNFIVEIMNEIIKEEFQLSTKIVQLQLNCLQKTNLIENNSYTIKNLQVNFILSFLGNHIAYYLIRTNQNNDRATYLNQLNKYSSQIQEQKSNKENSKVRQNNIERLLEQFNRLHKIKSKYLTLFNNSMNIKNSKKIFQKVFHFYYTYLFLEQLEVIKEQNNFIKRQINQAKRLLKASQNKVQWEIKSKIPLQNTIKQQKKIIQKLLSQIQDLKANLESSYDNNNHHEHPEEMYYDSFVNTKSYQNQQNFLSDQISNRQSFCQLDADQMVRKGSFHKSFVQQIIINPFQGHNNPSHDNEDDLNINKSYRKQSFMDENRQSFYDRKQSIDEQNYSNSRKNSSSNKNLSNSILIKDMGQKQTISPVKSTSQKKSPLIYSPNIQKFETSNSISQNRHKTNQQFQNNSQKMDLDSTTLSTARKVVPDLYFAHFLLTSQSVKIKQDCEQMLNIDVKPYYKQIIEQRIPMHIWDDWVRGKMKKEISQRRQKRRN